MSEHKPQFDTEQLQVGDVMEGEGDDRFWHDCGGPHAAWRWGGARRRVVAIINGCVIVEWLLPDGTPDPMAYPESAHLAFITGVTRVMRGDTQIYPPPEPEPPTLEEVIDKWLGSLGGGLAAGALVATLREHFDIQAKGKK